jgi:CheY-like chemotaxis protein
MRCNTILVIEDDFEIRRILIELLEIEGYRVTGVANGREGLELLPQMAKPCLILLDMMMPVMDGWEFLKEKRGDVTLAPIPVAIVSAIVQEGEVTDIVKYIKKPIDVNLLLNVVRQYCAW